MENTPNAAPDQKDIDTGKTNAILAYCTPIGWIIAYILHGNQKTKFAAFHLRQGLGLMCIGLAIVIISVMLIFIMPYVGLMLFWPLRLINLLILGAAIMGIVNAAGGKEQAVPLLGDMFSKTFSGIN
ncbi:MAG: hypothetical protein HY064_12355 [Bacteroidetes bacterium]|nr:hypothetical protein [Bacteroidota bacterium]